MMLRTALACCAVVACKGSPPEDTRAPAQAPVVQEQPADAAVPDAPSAPCFAIPFTTEAERAGIRPLAHRVPPPASVKSPVKKLPDVLKLVVGKPTVIPKLRPSPVDSKDGMHPPRRQVRVPAVANADGLLAVPDTFTDKVTVTAPAFLEGAVVEVAGDGFALVAIGDAGVATLARYREHFVKPRLLVVPVDADHRLRLTPLAIMLDDLDGDGTLEQVSFSRVVTHPANPKVKPRSELELGVLWSTGEVSFVRVSDHGFEAPPYYVVPPTLSGGNVLLLSTAGDRIALAGKRFMKLPADAGEGEKRCLQTSTTEPASLADRP